MVAEALGVSSGRTVHTVTVTGLAPGRTYVFDVQSGNVLDSNAGRHYAVTTGPTLAIPAPDSAYGIVDSPSSNTRPESFVVVSARDEESGKVSAPFAVFIPAVNEGYWSVPLSSLRTADLQALFAVGDTTTLVVDAYGGSYGTGHGTSAVAVARNGVPTIHLGQTHSAEIRLDAGWNLIAMPVQPETTMTAADLCTILNATGGVGTVKEVNRWVGGGWEAHRCGLPMNRFEIAPSSGYFVRVNRPVLLAVSGSKPDMATEINLEAGWNLVGMPGLDGRTTADQVLASIDSVSGRRGTATEVDRWVGGDWEGHRNGIPVNKFGIEAGVGYFVKLLQPAVWAVPGGLGQAGSTSAGGSGSLSPATSSTSTPAQAAAATMTLLMSATSTTTSTAAYSVTPTATVASTSTASATATASSTSIATPNPNFSKTPTPTTWPTPTATPTSFPTSTANPAFSATASPTSTATSTPNPAFSATPSPSSTASRTSTSTITPNVAFSATATPSSTASSTSTVTPNPAFSATPTATPRP